VLRVFFRKISLYSALNNGKAKQITMSPLKDFETLNALNILNALHALNQYKIS
jgi:hypothetical protein